jgi:hypothetical protein
MTKPLYKGADLLQSPKEDSDDFADQIHEYNRIKTDDGLIEDLDGLSVVINEDIKILLNEACTIIRETCKVKGFEELEKKIRDKPDDKIQLHYYEKWKEYLARLSARKF